MSGRIEGKIALVTGGGSGIGRAVAERFAAEGATVIAADITAGSGAETAALIVAEGGSARGVELDVTRPADVDALVARIVVDHGRLDILMNAAGVLDSGSVGDTSDEVWARVLAVNLTGAFVCCRAAIRAMRRSGGGSIVNVSSSTGAFDVGKEVAAYVASKAGVVMLTKSIAVDHAPDGIRANVIAPGPMATPMLSAVMTGAQMRAFGESLPAGRLGNPSELAAAALFLASDDASFVTGSLLAVDGGPTSLIGQTPKDL
jgi:NAD(P)-dependent dehydrogenase (short-subunit alcohol dehydrogenase family)